MNKQVCRTGKERERVLNKRRKTMIMCVCVCDWDKIFDDNTQSDNHWI